MKLLRDRLTQATQWLGKWPRTYRTIRANRKFPNVPAGLAVFVRDKMSTFQETGDRDLLYLEAAGAVIWRYTRIVVFDPKNDDPYIEKRKMNAAGDISYVFPIRILGLAEALFLIRSCPGFEEICRRLQFQWNLRSAVYELRAARSFYELGFEIHARESTKRLGEDFDFTAIRDSIEINVEVTALKEKGFQENTLRNALGRKREQLPKDKPGVIYCLLPSEWDDGTRDINQWVADQASNFLRGTRRVNAVVLQLEKYIDSNTDRTLGGFVTISKIFFNENPSHSADLSFLFESRWAPEQEREIKESLADPSDTHGAAAKAARDTAFYKWVDALVP